MKAYVAPSLETGHPQTRTTIQHAEHPKSVATDRQVMEIMNGRLRSTESKSMMLQLFLTLTELCDFSTLLLPHLRNKDATVPAEWGVVDTNWLRHVKLWGQCWTRRKSCDSYLPTSVNRLKKAKRKKTFLPAFIRHLQIKRDICIISQGWPPYSFYLFISCISDSLPSGTRLILETLPLPALEIQERMQD